MFEMYLLIVVKYTKIPVWAQEWGACLCVAVNVRVWVSTSSRVSVCSR